MSAPGKVDPAAPAWRGLAPVAAPPSPRAGPPPMDESVLRAFLARTGMPLEPGESPDLAESPLLEGVPRRGEDLAARYVEFIRALRAAPEPPPELAVLAEAGPDGILFFDLETTGFAGTPLFLAGLMSLEGAEFQVRQHFARHYGEEAEVVAEILREISRYRCLVTFNGKTFDWPFLRERIVAHRLPPPRDIPHFDLLHAARRRWRGALPNCRLTTLEQHICRRRRVEDVPGREIPALYHQFVKDGNPRPLGPVIEHNRMDLITMAEILVELS